MDTSILRTTKKMLGILDADESFDLDIITHINSAFSTVADQGVGPAGGFAIEDDEAQWEDLLPDVPLDQLSTVKTVVYLSVRLAFDPPQTSYLITALEKQIGEQLWRLNVRREATGWVDPDPPVVVP